MLVMLFFYLMNTDLEYKSAFSKTASLCKNVEDTGALAEQTVSSQGRIKVIRPMG